MHIQATEEFVWWIMKFKLGKEVKDERTNKESIKGMHPGRWEIKYRTENCGGELVVTV